MRLRIAPVKIKGSKGQELKTYGLLDNGSDVSLCEKGLLEQLDISGIERDFFLTTQEKKDSAKKGLEVKLTVESTNGDEQLEIPKVWSVESLNISNTSIPTQRTVRNTQGVVGGKS